MKRPPLGTALTHPVTLVALAVWMLNDHMLKARCPGFMTGKLSDLAGMIVTPLLLVAIADAVAPVRWLGRDGYRAIPWLAALLVGGAFAAAKTWPPATLAYERAMGLLWDGPVALVRDPTDLIAVPLGMLAPLLARRFEGCQNADAETRPGGRSQGRSIELER